MTITTIYGEMDDSLLTKKETDSNGQHVVEYYLNGELVHRSVGVQLTGVQATGEAQSIG